MSVAPPTNAPPAHHTERPQQQGEVPRQQGERPRENGERQAPGGHPPDDFGNRRNPDYNGDGQISDAESRTYAAETRADSDKYRTDSRERIAAEKEEGKNYRAEVSAATAQNASNNDNKIHKMTGKQTSPPVQMPTRPEGPKPS